MKHIDFEAVKAETVGRWWGIFQALGIEVGDGRHTVCPVCRTKKKHFRLDDRDGKGTWICTCGAGDGWSLVQKVLDCDFVTAVKQIAPLLGNIPTVTQPDEPKVSPSLLRKIFVGSQKADKHNLVGIYLQSRGLSLCPDTLRYHPAVWCSELHADCPAMLAVVTAPGGKALTIHRTYLDVVGGGKAQVATPKKLMPGLEKLTGAAIRLFPAENGRIGIAEGIETAIACYERFLVPTWAAVSATLMENFVPPVGIKKVMVFGDNDKTFAGHKAAYTLANRLVVTHKLQEVEVSVAPQVGADWLNVLQNEMRASGDSRA